MKKITFALICALLSQPVLSFAQSSSTVDRDIICKISAGATASPSSGQDLVLTKSNSYPNLNQNLVIDSSFPVVIHFSGTGALVLNFSSKSLNLTGELQVWINDYSTNNDTEGALDLDYQINNMSYSSHSNMIAPLGSSTGAVASEGQASGVFVQASCSLAPSASPNTPAKP